MYIIIKKVCLILVLHNVCLFRINRNRCQYCRLKKCIAAGMSRDGRKHYKLLSFKKWKDYYKETKNLNLNFFDFLPELLNFCVCFFINMIIWVLCQIRQVYVWRKCLNDLLKHRLVNIAYVIHDLELARFFSDCILPKIMCLCCTKTAFSQPPLVSDAIKLVCLTSTLHLPFSFSSLPALNTRSVIYRTKVPETSRNIWFSPGPYTI